MSFTHYFLDIDNTLLDFGKSSHIGFSQALIGQGFQGNPEPVYEAFKNISHKLWKDFERGHIHRDFLRIERFRRVCQAMDLSLDPQKFSEHYLDGLCENVFFVDGAVELCRALKAAGRSVGLITNGLVDVQKRRLKSSGLEDIVDFMMCSSEKHRPKPFPDLYNAAIRTAGFPKKEHCLMVGDNMVCDVLGANKIGIKSCWFNPNKIPRPHDIAPHFEVQKLGAVEFLKP